MMIRDSGLLFFGGGAPCTHAARQFVDVAVAARLTYSYTVCPSQLLFVNLCKLK